MAKRYQGGILGVGFNPLQAPDAPTIGAATAGNTQVSVAFTAPANVGGSAISSYRVLANPGGIGATTSSSPATVTGLTNDTTYTFSLAAVNSYGFSPYSGTATATPTVPAIEDFFSTYLYTGTSATQTITNSINISGNGGLVWIKPRTSGLGHNFFDTIRGPLMRMQSDNTDASTTVPNSLTGFTSSGFTLGSAGGVNNNGTSFASWTFREQPNFFDVVTYTGNGGDLTVNHSLGSQPGCIIIKKYSATGDWLVSHRYNFGGAMLKLNSTDAAFSAGIIATATTFRVFGGVAGNSDSGATYVAYLFAHDTASGGLIQCGSYAGTGVVGQIATLGWEPQWVMIKATNTATGWHMYDTMRGMATNASGTSKLFANTAAAEVIMGAASSVFPTATGFGAGGGIDGVNQSGGNYIYVAIRRGPMRTPTLGTSVFLPLATSLAVDTAITTNFSVDLMISGQRNSNNAADNWAFIDRLRGATASTNTDGSSQQRIRSTSTSAEASPTYPYAYNWWNTGLVQGYGLAGASQIYYTLRRAPGFFDEVCYTGDGSVAGISVNHNLGVKPELMIIKSRSSAGNWIVNQLYDGTNYRLLRLNQTTANIMNVDGSNTNATTFRALQYNQDTGVAGDNLNVSGTTYVAYLFASAPGVSKVGSYTGTGALQTINCAFTTGARFVLIKRTDSTGDWYVWDSARGISSGTDPYLLLNDLTAEVTGTNYVDTTAVGFQVTAAAPAGINANGGTYIFLAIS